MNDSHNLPDRGQLLDTLAGALDAAQGNGELVAVIVLKVRRLKQLCIEVGYAESDAMMRQFIERLHTCLREKDRLALINNDEFALVLPGLKNPAQPVMAISKIQRVCGAPMNLNGRELKVKLAFGLSLGPDDAEHAEPLLRCADVALCEAESNNVDSVRYSERTTPEPAPALEFETELESAINDSALQSFYQPIVDVETGELAGVEMLSRWPNGPFGPVHPSIFINTAERCGLIMPLTLWCLNNGLRECGEWQEALPNVPVSINFSTLILTNPHLPEVVLSALNLWGANVGRLTVEVTESAIMSDPETCLSILRQLHDNGVKIAIDDFGTGYSSLAYLKQLPVDILKIDQSFVTNMITNLADRRIVQSVIDLAHNFDLTVVAEGVEDEETLDTLTLMGCQRAQGFHVGRPMPSSDLEGWFQTSPWELFSTETTRL
jgi:diguanylate cyclase (GGDEF)-like protein